MLLPGLYIKRFYLTLPASFPLLKIPVKSKVEQASSGSFTGIPVADDLYIASINSSDFLLSDAVIYGSVLFSTALIKSA